jgi:hypothetical protein
MPLSGRKPKPPDQIRGRNPRADWTDVPNTPFLDGPPLPRTPNRKPPVDPPPPSRPLGAPGQALWDRAWRDSQVTPDADSLLLLCEQLDERVSLRIRVLREGDWHEREALRKLDHQITVSLRLLRLDGANHRPMVWPAPTKRWWKALVAMPHCVLWDEPEWQFAADTAVLVAAFHAGDLRLASEIRTREKLMGTTADARRDLRIRYRDPDSGAELREADTASVTAMETYRKMAP